MKVVNPHLLSNLSSKTQLAWIPLMQKKEHLYENDMWI